MKPISVVIACAYAFSVFLLFPLVFVSINNFLYLPILNSLLFDTAGLALLLLGGIIALKCYPLFPAIGKGTPVPTDPPMTIIETGLFSRTRNPIYISHLCIIFGGTLIAGHLLLFVYTVLCALTYDAYLRLVEEPDLYRRFGSKYAEYCKRIPRWIGK